MILRFLFLAFAIYLAYKLVFDFIIPVYKTTKRIRRGFREMQERMNGHAQQPFDQKTPPPGNTKNYSGDYIEFEEVKD